MSSPRSWPGAADRPPDRRPALQDLGHHVPMNWTRRERFRALVVALMATALVLNLIQRDWLWIAITTALLVLNLVSWRHDRVRTKRDNSPAPADLPSPPVSQMGIDATLAELLDLPVVAQAWNIGPEVWRQVAYLDEDDDLALPATEVAHFIWVSTLGTHHSPMDWSLAVGEELKPLLDLDVEAEEDPIIRTLLDNPAVAEAVHSDREQYDVVLRAPLALGDMAALAARALIAHHLDAVRRLVPNDGR